MCRLYFYLLFSLSRTLTDVQALGKIPFLWKESKLNFNSNSLLENFICCTDGRTDGRSDREKDENILLVAGSIAERWKASDSAGQTFTAETCLPLRCLYVWLHLCSSNSIYLWHDSKVTDMHSERNSRMKCKTDCISSTRNTSDFFSGGVLVQFLLCENCIFYVTGHAVFCGCRWEQFNSKLL